MFMPWPNFLSIVHFIKFCTLQYGLQVFSASWLDEINAWA